MISQGAFTNSRQNTPSKSLINMCFDRQTSITASFTATSSSHKSGLAMASQQRDLSKSVIDLAISTIKKTQHGVSIGTVPDHMQANLEVKKHVVLKHTGHDLISILDSSSRNDSVVSGHGYASSQYGLSETGKMLGDSDLVPTTMAGSA